MKLFKHSQEVDYFLCFRITVFVSVQFRAVMRSATIISWFGRCFHILNHPQAFFPYFPVHFRNLANYNFLCGQRITQIVHLVNNIALRNRRNFISLRRGKRKERFRLPQEVENTHRKVSETNYEACCFSFILFLNGDVMLFRFCPV